MRGSGVAQIVDIAPVFESGSLHSLLRCSA
jgi:hypothetical protein